MAGRDELIQMDLNLHPSETSTAYFPRTPTPAPSQPSSSASSRAYRASRHVRYTRRCNYYVTDKDEGVLLRLTQLLAG
jgi:hypothetical protein